MPKIVAEQDKLKKVLSCRLLPDEVAVLEARAAELGISKAEYMRRRLCDLPLPVVPVEPKTPQGLIDALEAFKNVMAKDGTGMEVYIGEVERTGPQVDRQWALDLCTFFRRRLGEYHAKVQDLFDYARERGA